MLSLSAGRLKSFTPAATRHHFINGAQKKTVFGPVVTIPWINAHSCINGHPTHRLDDS
jgi:hypothetical protein